MKPASSISKRLLELQNSLEVDAHSAKEREFTIVMEALALLAEGVAKTSRDVKELSQEVRGKTPAPKPKALAAVRR